MGMKDAIKNALTGKESADNAGGAASDPNASNPPAGDAGHAQQPPPAPPKPLSKAWYVKASGVDMGKKVSCVVMREDWIGEGRFANLALPGTPEIVYQTRAQYSEDKTPGTWHWA